MRGIIYAIPASLVLWAIVLGISYLLLGCGWLGGPTIIETNTVAYKGQLDGMYASAPTLEREFGWVKACRDVEQPIAYPNIVIYQCPVLEEGQRCVVPCGDGYGDYCYENGLVSIPSKGLYMPNLRMAFLSYIEEQIGEQNVSYREKCMGEE